MRRCAQTPTGRIGPLTQRGHACEGASLFLGATDRYGQPAIFAAVDAVLRGEHPPTWDGLEQALQATAGDSVGDLFDIWVHTGIAPRIDVDGSREGDAIRLTATADVPFGRIAVPIRLEGDAHTVDVELTLEDGVGTAVVPWPDEPFQIRTDPDQTLLLRR